MFPMRTGTLFLPLKFLHAITIGVTALRIRCRARDRGPVTMLNARSRPSTSRNSGKTYIFPSWHRRGGCAIQKTVPFLIGADGVVISDEMSRTAFQTRFED